MYKKKNATLIALIFSLVFALALVGNTQPLTTNACTIDKYTFDTLNSTRFASYRHADNVTGTLAWGNAYVMEAYTVMYEATRDTVYLDLLIELADAALDKRDSEQGWVDYRGRSLPGWQAAGPYNIGEVTLSDQQGQPSLYLRVASVGSNDETRVSVKNSTDKPGYFDIRIWNLTNDYDAVFSALTMDPQDERYAPHVISASSLGDPWGTVRMQVEDQVTWWEGAWHNPVPVEKAFFVPPYLWAVHQGRIVFPLITLARLVYEDPFLSADPYYKAKAATYVQATKDVLESLEPEWREYETGEGLYIVEKGAPVWFDGIELAHNMYLGAGRSIIQYAAVTGEEPWVSRAERVTRTYFNDLQLLDNDSYIWTSWWTKGSAYEGWMPEDDLSTNTLAMRGRKMVADVSHAAMPVEYAFLAYQEGLLFTDEHMRRLARTVTQNILAWRPDGTPTLAYRVDGSGPISEWSDNLGGRYAILNDWAPEIYPPMCIMTQNGGLQGTFVDMLSIARLVWAQERLNMRLKPGQYADRELWKALPRVRFVSPAKVNYDPIFVQGKLPIAIDAYVSPGRTLQSVSITVGDRVIYRGEAAPAPVEVVLDSADLADGQHVLRVEIQDSEGYVDQQELMLTVRNRWSRTDELEAPINTMFGVIQMTLFSERSAGWAHVDHDPSSPISDKDRMAYTGDGSGYLVWRVPEDPHTYEINHFTIDLYASAVTVTDVLTVAVSPDNQTWTAVEYHTKVVASFPGLYHLQLSGEMHTGAQMRFIRLTAENAPESTMQLGQVSYGGLWRKQP